MNLPCYLKIKNSKAYNISVFNFSIFDTLFLMDRIDSLKINKFYAVDRFGTEHEEHLVEEDVSKINTVGGLFYFFEKKSIYGEKFTLNIIDFETKDFKIILKDDYNLSIHFLNESIDLFNSILQNILRLLKFVDVKDTVDYLFKNTGNFVVFDSEGNKEVFYNEDDLSKAKIFK